ncbi:flavin reductase family protein [Tessaracoccus sp. G1721]
MDDLLTSFRDAMARVAAPVTVVTTAIGGAPTGTTVSAFASLSITPPMVLFALDNRGGMIERVRASGRIGINILAADQAEVAVRFARQDLPDRFSGLAWREDHGLPRIEGVAAWVRCDELTFEPGGDHTIILGTVAAAEVTGDESLAYHMRRFQGLSPAPRD